MSLHVSKTTVSIIKIVLLRFQLPLVLNTPIIGDLDDYLYDSLWRENNTFASR